MANRKPAVNIARSFQSFISPAECLNEVVQAFTEYLNTVEAEKTKRRKIEAWEKTALAEIKVKRDLLIGYLEHSFDERSSNFRSLFQVVDQAIASGDNQQLSVTLNAIVDLAKTSPFQDLADLSTVKAALADPDHIWEL